MDATIAEFLASIGFKTDEKSLKSALTKVAGFGAAVSVAAGAAIAGIMRVAESEVALAKQAEGLGVPIAKLEELSYVAEQSGASAEYVASALGSLKGKYPHIKDSSVLLERVGRAMRGMSDQAARLYAKRMGIDPALVPMLTKDVSALKDEYSAMYSVAGRDALKAAEDSKAFMAELGKLRTMSELLAKAVGGAFLGKIRGDIEALRRTVIENFGKIKRLFETVIGLVLRIAGVVGAFVRRVVAWASALVGWYDKLDDGQKKIIQGLVLFLAAWKLLNAGFLATPLGAVIAGLTAIVALIDDYCTYMEGGESLIDWGPWAETIEQVVSFLEKVLNIIMILASAIGATLGPAFDSLCQVAKLGFDGIMAGIKIISQLFSGDFAGALETAKGFFTSFLDTVIAVFDNTCEAIKAFFVTLWEGVKASFPDFAAWAQNACEAIKNFFASAVAFVKDKLKSLTSYLPDFIKNKIGLGDGGSKTASVPDGAALKPSPMQAQAASNQNTSVSVASKTEITVNGAQSPDQVVGKVAAAQNGTAADIARNTQGAIR